MKSLLPRLVLLVAIGFGLQACEDKTVQLPPNLEEIRKREPVTETFKLNYVYSDSGRIKAKLVAPHMIERFDEKKRQNYNYFDRGFTLDFFDKTGALESHIKANTGAMYPREGYAEALGNVILTNQKGEKMETEKLIWLRRENKIRTDAFVKIHTANEVVFGDGFESNTTFTKYKITKFKGTLNVKD